MGTNTEARATEIQGLKAKVTAYKAELDSIKDKLTKTDDNNH